MPEALTVLTIDRVQRLLHLLDIFGCAGIQRLLHHRLLGTRLTSEGLLQGGIAPQAGIDLRQPLSPRQNRDEAIIQLVAWAVFDRLLRNLHQLSDRAKQVELLHLHSYGGQTRTGRKMTRRVRGRFVHDGSPLASFHFCDRYVPSSFVSQVPFLWQHTATNLGQI